MHSHEGRPRSREEKEAPPSKDVRLALVLGLNVAMIAGLVIVGLAAHSLGVLAAGADYVGDAAGVAISLVALHVSRRRGSHSRAPTFAALANATFLLLVTTAVMIEAVRRLVTGPPHVHGLPVLIVSAIAAGVMILCAYILGDIDGDDLSMRSVMLDTVADAASAAGVAISGGIILILSTAYWLDPAVALAVAVIIAYHAVKLLREVVRDLSRR